MPAVTTAQSMDFVRQVFESLAYAEPDDTMLDAELTGVESVRDAADAGWLGVDGVEVTLDDGRRLLVTAQEVAQ